MNHAMSVPCMTPSPALSHRELIASATLAPSPDNNQPWRFASRDDRLLVYLDPDRALPSDVNSMFDLMGLGAAVENACIAARQAGYEPRVAYELRPVGTVEDAALPVASLDFKREGKPDPLHVHLAARATCRKLYSRRAVDDACLRRLADASIGFPDVQVDWIVDRPRIRALARLVMVSDRFRFEYEPFHKEIFRQLRFTADEAQRTRDGLDVRTLELPPGAAAILRQLRSWSRMQWLRRLGLVPALTLPSALSVWMSGALGVLSLPAPGRTAFLDCGRAFQRIWLAATAEGLSLQPLGSLPVFLAQMQQYQGRKLTPAHQQLARRLAAWFAGLVPTTAERTLLMVFRLGYSKPPACRSLRRSAEEVLDEPHATEVQS